MKKLRIPILLVLMLFFSDVIISQDLKLSDNSKVFQFAGRIVDSEKNPVVFAHVVNRHRSHASISDSTGYFKILVSQNDSLRITAIGFYTKNISLASVLKHDTSIHYITLEKRSYDLPSVNIYELRWQVFKSEFMEETVEEDKTAKRISNWMANLVPSDELRMIFQGARGPGFTINYKSKAERSKQKVVKLEKKYALIAPKFNDKMISNLTGLKGKEIFRFLQYCNFSEDFLIHSTEYEIIEQILKHWEEYKKKGLETPRP